MEQRTKYLLVGGGIASVAAAEAIRERDSDGRLIVVGAEMHPPYERPPLSKQYLTNDGFSPEKAALRDREFYATNGIELQNGVRAAAIARRNRRVTLQNGDAIQYERLLLATGARSRALRVPGADLDGIFYLRTLDDAEALRTAMRQARKAVMVGAGYIGMEVAAACARRGLETTLVDPADRPWSRFASPTLGKFLREYYESRGVRFVFGEQVAAFEGDGRLREVRTAAGTRIEADFAVVGIGAILNMELAIEAGLEVDERQGVQADAFLQTSDPHIWVAGDIASFEDLALGKRWRVEHFMHAEWQGRTAGANMAGARQPYNEVPYFFSDVFDLAMCLRGDPEGPLETTILGDVEAAEFVELYPDDAGRLRMGIAFSRDHARPDALGNNVAALIRERPRVKDVTAATLGL